MNVIRIILFALSLCADCFAVSLCSSVTLKSVDRRSLTLVSLIFAVVQTGFLLLGWGFGYLFLGLVERIAHWIGFLLLLYVGGSMLVEGVRGDCEVKNLNGFRNIIIGGVATSIDALAVGVSLSMGGVPWSEVGWNAFAVFVTTALSVILGILGGKALGNKVGPVAEILGGCVLIGIGIGILI